MLFILQTIGGTRIHITKEQKEKISALLMAGATHIDVNGSTLLSTTIASIIPADDFIASENNKLNAYGKYMCNHGTVHHAEERCECTRETRITDTQGLIRTVAKLECPQCHSLCMASSEFCDSCDSSLVLEPPEQRRIEGMTPIAALLPTKEIRQEFTSPLSEEI